MEPRCEDASRKQARPFLERSGARSRGCSLRLERLAVSYAADHSLLGASSRLLEHHAIEMAPSSVDRLLARHGARAAAILPSSPAASLASSGADTIVTEADGTMIPVWEYGQAEAGPDLRRRRKKRIYKEMRLFVARPDGQADYRCAGGFVDMEQAAALWSHCARDCGWSAATRVHGVFDGANRIRLRFKEQFGSCGDWLVDYFHLCEIAAKAALAAGMPEGWARRKLEGIKEGDSPQGLVDALRPSSEPDATADEDAPVRAAIRYVENRLGHFGYAEALAAGLPIGSGMVEGGHRHALHPRLKIAGAWGEAKAHGVAQLRILRKNKQWSKFWEEAA